ncbi:MAG: hypothetical protein VKP62_09300 [Candidatus Sericytochromatia bacterium]|nr:hypothetical protein [Candidatus Sericytochromatia bacterium]
MHTLRRTLGAALCLLAAATGVAGCDTNALVTQYPALSPIIGPRAKKAPTVIQRGHLHGKVVKSDGKVQGNAFVTTGGAYAFTAEISETSPPEFVEDKDNNKDRQYVEGHEFEDGSVADALRILRKFPSSNKPDGKYFYLKHGEFLLEGIPEGDVLVTASFQDVVGAPQRFTIQPNFLLRDADFTLDIPPTLDLDDKGLPPSILEWTASEPPTGITLKVVQRSTLGPDGQPGPPETNVTYNPEPPDVGLTLRSPPGSRGALITGYSVFYTYNTPRRAAETPPKPAIATPKTEVPTPPLLVPPANQQTFGPSVNLVIPVGSVSLKNFFTPADPLDQPLLVVARIRFLSGSNEINGRNNRPLEVAVPMRALSN